MKVQKKRVAQSQKRRPAVVKMNSQRRGDWRILLRLRIPIGSLRRARK